MSRVFLVAVAALGTAFGYPAEAKAQAAKESRGFVDCEIHELVEICKADPGSAQYPEARAFCHGYLTGAYSTLLADRPAGAPPLHCNLPASRQKPIDRFVAWARARPEHLRELPPNAFLRFMDETYACPGR